MKFVRVWKDNLAAMVGEMNEDRDGDGAAGDCGAVDPLKSSVAGGGRRGVEGDLEASAVNSRAHGRIRHQHT